MKILYFAPIPYGTMKQRPQYLAEQLAQQHEVIYVEPTISFAKRLLKKGDPSYGYLRRIGTNLQILRLNGLFYLRRPLNAVWKGFAWWERCLLRSYLKWADVVWIGYSPWYDLVSGFRGSVIYDKMDDELQITQDKMMRRLISRTEPELTERADLIFVSAQIFKEQLETKGKRAVLLPNAVDQAQVMEQLPQKEEPSSTRIFGYVGMLAHWFDMQAIQTILNADENNHVILVGPEEIPRLNHERLQYSGYVPKAEIGKWIDQFDVCLYPFLKTGFLDTIDPVKIYEYLAANKPVLAVRSREIEKFGNLVISYENIEELQEKLKCEVFNRPFSILSQRDLFVKENNWEARGARVISLLDELK